MALRRRASLGRASTVQEEDRKEEGEEKQAGGKKADDKDKQSGKKAARGGGGLLFGSEESETSQLPSASKTSGLFDSLFGDDGNRLCSRWQLPKCEVHLFVVFVCR